MLCFSLPVYSSVQTVHGIMAWARIKTKDLIFPNKTARWRIVLQSEVEKSEQRLVGAQIYVSFCRQIRALLSPYSIAASTAYIDQKWLS